VTGQFTLAGTKLRVRTAEATRNERLQQALARAVGRFGSGRTAALGTLDDPDGLRAAARRVRHDVLTRLPEVLARFADNVVAAGGHVHWATDAAAANEYITRLARDRGVRSVVKGKSMATEETALNEALEAEGIDVVETDLGEWIIQLAHHTPSHIIAPAVHLDRHQVRDILQPVAGPDRQLDSEPEHLAAFAREQLRARFLSADMGVTGCNFGVAETGSVVLVENEGNGRLTTTMPRLHVAVMGMERVVERWDQLDLMINLLARSGTGQHISTYTNIVTGPRGDGEADGPDELHVVILDNRRSEVLGTELQEILHCIRCGACLNVCPVYRQVGGHAYGWVYSGPVGAVLTPLLAHEPEAAELPNASTLCGACMDACPVSIPLQDLLLTLRRRNAAGEGRPEHAGWAAWASAWSRPLTYRASLKAAALGRPLTRFAAMAPGLRAWGGGRSAPKPAPRSFLQRWKAGELTGVER
jgi:L-lactate dehydrogenase complex protein LldF